MLFSVSLYLRSELPISLHFVLFNFIPVSVANANISFTMIGRILGEQPGIISTAVVSSKNFILPGQSLSKELPRTAKIIGPSVVPWGGPPFVSFHDEYILSMRTETL